jgi:hypothetical protein
MKENKLILSIIKEDNKKQLRMEKLFLKLLNGCYEVRRFNDLYFINDNGYRLFEYSDENLIFYSSADIGDIFIDRYKLEVSELECFISKMFYKHKEIRKDAIGIYQYWMGKEPTMK